VPAALLCGGGSNGCRRGGGGVGRPREPAVVGYGCARLPSIVYVPAVVCGGPVCGTAMVVGARTVTANDSPEGLPRATTRFFRWVYDAPTAHGMAGCTLKTNGRVVEEASEWRQRRWQAAPLMAPSTAAPRAIVSRGSRRLLDAGRRLAGT